MFAVLAVVYLTGGLAWIGVEALPFDGDEAGHVGAAELLAAAWHEGRGGEALLTTLAGRMGVYPPLYAGLVGAWWALLGMGEPARLAVRGINLLGPLLAAVAVLRLARPLGTRAAVAGGAAVLALPILGGLGRHFMLEGAVVGGVACAVLAVEAARARPRPWTFALAGLAVGLAFLIKQTAPLYLLPVLVLRLPRRWSSLWILVAAACVVAPWVTLNLGQQLGYGSESAAGTPGIGLLAHLAFYPWSGFWVGIGPPLSVLAALGFVAGLRRLDAEQRQLWICSLAWLLGSVLLLVLVPRKYPRLLAPALPAVGLLVALAFCRWGRGWRGLLLAFALLAGLAWTAWGSLASLPVPATARVLDDRCPQVWLRPPVADDLGMERVLQAVRLTRPGPIAVLGTVEIPCALQTTHDWSEHLGPRLRAAGVDRELIHEPEDLDRAVLVVSWEGPVPQWRGESVPVPLLEGSFWIGRPAR